MNLKVLQEQQTQYNMASFGRSPNELVARGLELGAGKACGEAWRFPRTGAAPSAATGINM